MLLVFVFSLVFAAFDTSLAAEDEPWEEGYNSTYFKECWPYFESFDETFREMMDNGELPKCFYKIAETMTTENEIGYEEFEDFIEEEYENMEEADRKESLECLDKINESVDENVPVKPSEACEEILQKMEEEEMAAEMDS